MCQEQLSAPISVLKLVNYGEIIGQKEEDMDYTSRWS